MVPLAECEVGAVYRVEARNFRVAAYAGDGKFVGVRKKWGFRYTDTEFHWDAHPRWGTVCPLERVGRIPHRLLTERSSDQLLIAALDSVQ